MVGQSSRSEVGQLVQTDKVDFDGEFDGVGQGGGAELLHDAGTVSADGGTGQVNLQRIHVVKIPRIGAFWGFNNLTDSNINGISTTDIQFNYAPVRRAR
jgi:hypothetical protein